MSNHWEPVKDDHAVEPESLEKDSIADSEEGEDDSELSEEIGDWGGGDLEAAYLKAMSALEASDLELPHIPPKASSLELDSEVIDSNSDQSQPVVAVESLKSTDTGHSASASAANQASSLSDLFPSPPAGNSSESNVVNVTPAETRMTPRQIIEACLFVGGDALTSKRLSGVLRGDFDSDFVDREIDALNRQYAAENRPYEIRLGEGGYRLTLREEFERIRRKVYGLGPKEVRLSQEALEVLAVVAYHQPIKQSRVEELGKPGCGPVLRQLVRRELLVVERDPAQPREVSYKTTPRFLSLFGIRDLDELPRHEQVSYK